MYWLEVESGSSKSCPINWYWYAVFQFLFYLFIYMSTTLSFLYFHQAQQIDTKLQ